jgi:hypothetical protein
MEKQHASNPGRYLSKAGLLTVAGISGLLLLALLVAAVPRAQAHDICIGHPRDPSVVCLRYYHQRIDVCDRDQDGHRAYARATYYDKRTNTWYVRDFYDPDGEGGYCGHYWGYTVGPYDWAFSVNVCVQTEGCGSPLYWWAW